MQSGRDVYQHPYLYSGSIACPLKRIRYKGIRVAIIDRDAGGRRVPLISGNLESSLVQSPAFGFPFRILVSNSSVD